MARAENIAVVRALLRSEFPDHTVEDKAGPEFDHSFWVTGGSELHRLTLTHELLDDSTVEEFTRLLGAVHLAEYVRAGRGHPVVLGRAGYLK